MKKTATDNLILLPLRGYIQELAQKVYTLSHETRNELKRPGLDPSDVLIRFHYGIAIATYQFYLATENNFGLGLIKKHLTRCIEIHRSRLPSQDKRKILMIDGGTIVKSYIQSLRNFIDQSGSNNLNKNINQLTKQCGFIGAEPLLNIIEKEYKELSAVKLVKVESIAEHVNLLLKLGKLNPARRLFNQHRDKIPDTIDTLVILFSKLQLIFNHEISLIYNLKNPQRSYQYLAEAYNFFGIYPLSKIYSTINENKPREDKIVVKDPSGLIVDSRQILPNRAVNLLNDVISEREWITNVLPHLSAIPGFRTNFFPIYILEWQCSHDEKQFNELLKKQCSGSSSHQREVNSLLRKFLLIYCNFSGEGLCAKGWYLWTIAPSGQVVTNYLAGKEEFKSLLELLVKWKQKPVDIHLLQSLEESIQEAIDELWQSLALDVQPSSTHTPVFQSLTAKDYYDQRLLKKGILIYDAEQYDSANSLRERFKSTGNQGFTAILQISESYYVAILVQAQHIRGEKECPLRMIYIMDSHSPAITIADQRLTWFAGLIDSIEYRLEILTTPAQKINGNDSLLHAYLNAALAQWLLNNGYWQDCREYFAWQRLTHKKNIQSIKCWWANPVLDSKYALESFLKAANGQRSIEVLLDELKNYFIFYLKAGFSRLSAPSILEQVELLIKSLSSVKKIIDLKQILIKDLFSEDTNFPEQKSFIQCLDNLIDQQENFGQAIDIYLVKDFLLTAIKKSAAEVLEFQCKVAKLFENFEDVFEHYSLLILVEKAACIGEFLSDDLLGHISSYTQGKDYLKLLKILEGIYKKVCQPAKMLEDLKSVTAKVKDIFSYVSDWQQQVIFRSAMESLKTLTKILVPLLDAKKSIVQVMKFYDFLLRACYEETDFSDLHSHAGQIIYPRITHFQFEFIDLSDCMQDLLVYAHKQKLEKELEHKELKSLEAKAIESAFKPLLNLRLENNEKIYRQRAVYYFSGYLRCKMMKNLESYEQSLMDFRHRSLSAMENFEQQLHGYFLELIKSSIQLGKKSTVVSSCDEVLRSSKPNNYKSKIAAYKAGLDSLKNQCPKFIKAAIEIVFAHLLDEKHSHAPYLTKKLTDFCQLVKRFATVKNELPQFRTLFWKALHQRYDHVGNDELFAAEGMVSYEIFKPLKQQPNFDDIYLIVNMVDSKSSDLKKILDKCQSFCEHGDIKAVTEVSSFLREAIVSITERYTGSLLSFRHHSLTAFLEFERRYYDYISSYPVVSQRDQKSIEWGKQVINNLAHVCSDVDYGKKLNAFEEFKKSLPSDLKAILSHALQQNYPIDIDEKLDIHTHRVYINDKLRNLEKLIEGFINWYQIEKVEEQDYTIYEVTVTSTTLAHIMGRLKEDSKRCCHPDNEIRIIASGVLYLDIDMNTSAFSGVNIALITLNQKLISGKKRFEIVTDGADGGAHAQPCAPPGNRYDSQGKGLPGDDGLDGYPGKSAGHVYIIADDLPQMSISAKGGRGGPGQVGGNGAAGKDGADGVDGELTSSGILARKKGGRRHDYGGVNYRQISVGKDGGSGGLGGDAGASGNGGEGGEAGFIELFSLRKHVTDIKRVARYRDGQAGTNGNMDLAKPGEAGRHGRDGRDGVWLSNGRLLPWGTTVEERLGRLISSERYSRSDKVEWWWASESHVS